MGLKIPFTKRVAVASMAAVALFFGACQKDAAVVQTEKKLFERPSHFPMPVYQNPDNPLTEAGVELGRKLFYETKLSADNSISCASCHAQVHAFADHNVKLSMGVGGKLGSRNSPALSNLAWYRNFMADGGINHIEVMPTAPLTDPNEMAETLTNVVDKLNADPNYQADFKTAFGVSEINSQYMLYALAQFMKTMVSANAKYDQVLKGEATFSEKEERGYTLFKTHCATCHQEPLTTNFSFANIGLDTVFADPGRGRVTLLAQDSGRFKVPNLRNIVLTYPYMHDGRFRTLEEVLEHYSTGVLPAKNLDSRLPGNLNLSQDEQVAIIAFLHTLTDFEYLANQDFGEPTE